MKHAALGRIIAAAMLVLPPFVPAANATTYILNRTIGAGSVTGYIQTDGTLGDIEYGNIVSWQFTISAPNLNGGSTQKVSGAIGDSSDFEQFATLHSLQATATGLFFGFFQLSLGAQNGGSYLLFQNGDIFYCLQRGSGLGCVNDPALLPAIISIDEFIGPPSGDGDVAQVNDDVVKSLFDLPGGRFEGIEFAVAAATPVPGALPLLLSGVAGLGWLLRRKRTCQSKDTRSMS